MPRQVTKALPPTVISRKVVKPKSRSIYFSQCWFRKVLKVLPGFWFPTSEFASDCLSSSSCQAAASAAKLTASNSASTGERDTAFRSIGFMLGSYPSQASHCSWNERSPLGWIKQKPHRHQNPLEMYSLK